ncbi:hypothetical protein NDU88_005628 [Pleurodeles waltl]|uniref:Uncharacterized protein n=1 Tax=Pleurodeles waltl TaxID=8319 RepID=A0AAV7LUM0_PLEWA|nr:hypothetical protein NDU88_005628 [Pleurodeles waltl]
MPAGPERTIGPAWSRSRERPLTLPGGARAWRRPGKNCLEKRRRPGPSYGGAPHLKSDLAGAGSPALHLWRRGEAAGAQPTDG